MPAGGSVPAMWALRILFITPYVPSRLRPRPFHLLRGLAERGHRITLFTAATTPHELAAAAALRDVCQRVEVFRVSTARSLWNCVWALGRRQPLQAVYCASPVMTARIHSALSERTSYDVLHVEHLRAALYGMNAPVRPRVYDAVDCMSCLHAHTAADGPTWASQTTARMEIEPTRRFERTAVERFDRVLLSSEGDRRALLALTAGGGNGDDARRVQTLPNGVDLVYFSPRGEARDAATVVFVGRMSYHANLAAARALIETIMPRIWAQRPETRLLIVGADPPPPLRAVAARAGERVTVTGTVPDVRPYLVRATVSVSPLPYAVGIQNKVLEAMAMATPVVASPSAAAALAVVHGSDLLVEAEPDRFAAAVLRLLDDPAEAARLGAAGRRYVTTQHEWLRIAEQLEAIYRDAMESVAADGVRV